MPVSHHPRRFSEGLIRVSHDDIGSSDLADDHDVFFLASDGN